MGSCISRDGELNIEVSECLTKAARMFGCLHSSIFVNPFTLRDMFMLSTLLYSAETWAGKAIQTGISSVTVSDVFLVRFATCSGGNISLLSSWLLNLA